MKLSQRLQRSFTWVIALVILITAITTTLLFQNSLNRFLENEREKEFTKISNEVVELSQLYTNDSHNILSRYALDSQINLTYYNVQNQVVSQFIGVNPSNSEHKQYISRRYNLLNSNNEVQGYLDISYIEDIFEYDQSSKAFYLGMIRNYALIFIFAIILASLFTIALTKNIVHPIIEIQNKTRNIIEKKYSFKDDENYNIFEIDELSNNINYLSKTLDIQEKIRIDYAHDIAHELRTPITNLMLHLEGIRDEIIDADSNTISHLIGEVHRINQMIDNLENSFNDSNEITNLEFKESSLNEILKNVSNSFSLNAQEKNIEIVENFGEDTIINTDKIKLTQIFSNLISNAIKAIDKENGKIIITHTKLKNRDVVSIKDNGIGISQENLTHIFERFYRVDNVRNTKVSGHGLGLSITKTLVDLLGYQIKVNSKIGKGSEFIITII